MDLATLVNTYENLVREAEEYCKAKCVGRESCFRKCLKKEKEKIQLTIEQEYGVRVEVI